jgi:hypothetical protein
MLHGINQKKNPKNNPKKRENKWIKNSTQKKIVYKINFKQYLPHNDDKKEL